MPFFRLASAKLPSAVIMEGKTLSEDEEDEDGQFVVEAVPPPPDMPELEVVSVLLFSTEIDQHLCAVVF